MEGLVRTCQKQKQVKIKIEGETNNNKENELNPDCISLNKHHITNLALGMYHSCATNSNKFICWGQINKERISIPDIFKSGAAVLTSGLNHTCATVKNATNKANTINQS